MLLEMLEGKFFFLSKFSLGNSFEEIFTIFLLIVHNFGAPFSSFSKKRFILYRGPLF